MNCKKDFLNKHLLAIDYGQKFTGLASFKVGIDPFPLMYGRVAYESDKQISQELANIAEVEFIDHIIIGVPYFTDGSASAMTKTIENFAKMLEDSTNTPVHRIDETLTTFEAEERMKQDPRFNFKVDPKQIDALSAVVILEEFLKSFEQ